MDMPAPTAHNKEVAFKTVQQQTILKVKRHLAHAACEKNILLYAV